MTRRSMGDGLPGAGCPDAAARASLADRVNIYQLLTAIRPVDGVGGGHLDGVIEPKNNPRPRQLTSDVYSMKMSHFRFYCLYKIY